MKKNQILVLVAGLLVTTLLYFFVNRIPPTKKDTANSTHTDHQSSNSGQAEDPPIAFETLEKRARGKLSSAQIETLSQLEQKKNTPEGIKALIQFWQEAKQPIMMAKYNEDLANLENTEKSRIFASQFYIDLFTKEADPSTKKWAANRAAQLLEKVITENPDNEDAKVAQAICFTEGTGETMKGVTRLREVVNKNPKHEMATLMLGKLAITSGQFGKAKERLSGLIENYPKNPEGYYYLAIAEKSLGNTARAKELLQQCKSLVKDPEFGKEIDNFLKTF